MNQMLNNWRLRAESLGAAQGRRYSHEMREEAIVLVERAVSAGMSKSAVCVELGIPVNTLERWKRSVPEFQEVALVERGGSVEVALGALRARMSVDDFALLVQRLS